MGDPLGLLVAERDTIVVSAEGFCLNLPALEVVQALVSMGWTVAAPMTATARVTPIETAIDKEKGR